MKRIVTFVGALLVAAVSAFAEMQSEEKVASGLSAVFTLGDAFNPPRTVRAFYLLFPTGTASTNYVSLVYVHGGVTSSAAYTTTLTATSLYKVDLNLPARKGDILVFTNSYTSNGTYIIYYE